MISARSAVHELHICTPASLCGRLLATAHKHKTHMSGKYVAYALLHPGLSPQHSALTVVQSLNAPVAFKRSKQYFIVPVWQPSAALHEKLRGERLARGDPILPWVLENGSRQTSVDKDPEKDKQKRVPEPTGLMLREQSVYLTRPATDRKRRKSCQASELLEPRDSAQLMDSDASAPSLHESGAATSDRASASLPADSGERNAVDALNTLQLAVQPNSAHLWKLEGNAVFRFADRLVNEAPLRPPLRPRPPTPPPTQPPFLQAPPPSSPPPLPQEVSADNIHGNADRMMVRVVENKIGDCKLSVDPEATPSANDIRCRIFNSSQWRFKLVPGRNAYAIQSVVGSKYLQVHKHRIKSDQTCAPWTLVRLVDTVREGDATCLWQVVPEEKVLSCLLLVRRRSIVDLS